MSIIQHLVVEEFGAFIGKHSELITGNGVSISADAVKECAERGIPIHFASGTGNPYASLYSAGLMGTILTRRAQLEAYHTRRVANWARGLSLRRATAMQTIGRGQSKMDYRR